MALYYPNHGYYSAKKNCIGKDGDFFTSSSVSHLFGAMIARQLQEMWEKTGKGNFIVVEYGAGTGMLARDILEAAANQEKFAKKLRYYIIEKSENLQRLQQQVLKGRVEWINDISCISGFTGCVLSNEVLDNFPVHQVIMEDELMEIFVSYDEGFTEIKKPASEELKEYLDQMQVKLPAGYRTEINLHALPWIRDIALSMKTGFVFTIDYGYPASVYYNPDHKDGTLACYYNHQVHFSPYKNIGQQDITSHVNFTALDHWGRQYGLNKIAFTSQGYFLMGMGLSSYARDHATDASQLKVMPALLTDMGSKMKILVQEKGMGKTMLAGCRFPLQL